MIRDNYVKILLRYTSPVLEEDVVETLWATVVNESEGLYKIDNIPFYGPQLASGDIVFAEYDADEKFLTYRETIQFSGNSVVLVVIMDKAKNAETIRNQFKEMGCDSEGLGEMYFAMEIPNSVDYSPIRQILMNYHKEGILEFSEPCLSENHSQ